MVQQKNKMLVMVSVAAVLITFNATITCTQLDHLSATTNW
jgi:hypothetical protein